MVGGTQPQGALYLIDAKTSTPARIALTAAEGTPRCPGGFQPSSLAPHGLALRPEGGDSVLYVVNHGGRESIERRSEEHTSELQSLMRISYAVFCLKKKQY